MSRYLNDPQTVPAAERAAEALLPADHTYSNFQKYRSSLIILEKVV